MNREVAEVRVVCTRTGSLPAGGVVLSLASDEAGRLWAGTGAGLFHQDEFAWRPVLRGFPRRDAPVIAVRHRMILAGGYDAVLVRSADRGRTWQRCAIPPQITAITSLALSPSFVQDGVALAGTETHGILRSVDGGRSWKLANFGLRNFQVNALAVAPHWQRKEPVFAALEQGVYYSPNAGRAWQPAGLVDEAVLCLAVSPNYWQDGLVAAGTAEGSVHISRNQGRSWAVCKPVSDEEHPINCLLFLSNHTLMAGTGAGEIFTSVDAGVSWALLAVLPGAILTLAEIDGIILAGAGARGLFRSPDLGSTWEQDDTFVARQVHSLAVNSEQPLAVGGMREGVWLSEDGGISWQEAHSPDGEAINPLALSWEGQDLLAACGPEVIRLGAKRANFEDASWGGEVISLAQSSSGVWAGAADGSLWRKPSPDKAWIRTHSPCRGAVIAIYGSAATALESTMLVVSRAESEARLEFWRSEDLGDHWELLRVESTTHPAVRCAYLDRRWYLALGSIILVQSQDGWQRIRISGDDAPVLSLLALPGVGLIAATADRLFFSSDVITWSGLPCEMTQDGIVDLKLVSLDDHRAQVVGLTSNGCVFQLAIVLS